MDHNTTQSTFAIPNVGTTQVITITGTEPAIIQPMTIDGLSQGGAAFQPCIGLDGSGATGDGLTVNKGGVTIDGLAVYGFSGNGISLNNPTGQGGDALYSVFCGVDLSGKTVVANGLDGVRVTGGDNSIGTDETPYYNIFSGNNGDGVDITGTSAVRNIIVNSVIGADYTGKVALPNKDAGVLCDLGSGSNSIGVLTAVDNTISGNANSGIHLNNSSNNLIADNLIGVAEGGTTALANGTNGKADDNNGITIDNGSSNNTIGGAHSTMGPDVVKGITLLNVISGNNGAGIELNGASVTKNVIGGDYIGIGADGKTAVANQNKGIFVQDAFSNLIGIGQLAGGGASTNGNVISGNGSSGIALATGGAKSNIIAGNVIGLDSSGTVKVGNCIGIYITSNNNTIGSTTNLNVISGNRAQGIYIYGGNSNLIAGNYIGTSGDGKSALGNGNSGILLNNNASNNTIGAVRTDNNPINLISGNGTSNPDGDGIRIVSGNANNNLI